MKVSQAYYEKYANRHRTSSPAYRVGDRVVVNAKNIKTKRPSKKLDWKNLGPFIVVKVIGSHNYQLKLTEDLKSVHPIFHTSLLRPDPNNPFPGQTNEPNPPVEVDASGESQYEADAILNSRRSKSSGFEYLIFRSTLGRSYVVPLPASRVVLCIISRANAQCDQFVMSCIFYLLI
ncbi:hypothetical protein K3495_g8605 [Podosphaera aphanis]|nr:hypothetical protein K3495_g8605 [Podosphaera aphanis]